MSAPVEAVAPPGSQAMADLERLLADVEALPDVRTREKVRAVVRAVLEVHREGLAKLCELLGKSGATGWAVLNAGAKDPLVQSLLLLHDLHPEPFEQRVAGALAKVATFMKLNGCTAELVSSAEGRVRVRVLSTPGAARTTPERLRAAVEQALLDAAPDAAALEVEVQPTAAPEAAPEELRRGTG